VTTTIVIKDEKDEEDGLQEVLSGREKPQTLESVF
jgi:hypothetical protein